MPTAALLEFLSATGPLGAAIAFAAVIVYGISVLLPGGIPGLMNARSHRSMTDRAMRLVEGPDPQQRVIGRDIICTPHRPPGTDAQTAPDSQERPPDSSPASPP